MSSRLQHPFQEQAIAALVTSDDPWLRSCGAYAIGSVGLVSLEQNLGRETARSAKLPASTYNQGLIQAQLSISR